MCSLFKEKGKAVVEIIKKSIRPVRAIFRSIGFLVKAGRASESLLVLTYHRVIPRELAIKEKVEPGMWVSPETFERHVRFLSRSFDVMRLSKWIEPSFEHPKNRQLNVAITFDDGWADNYDYAFPILKKASVPATIFLCPGLVSTMNVMWPEKLAVLTTEKHDATLALQAIQNPIKRMIIDWIQQGNNKLGKGGVGDLVNGLKPFADADIEAAIDELIARLLPVYSPPVVSYFLTWEQVKRMGNSGLVEFGSHSFNHRRLPKLESEEEIRFELKSSRNELERQCKDAYCPIFCYPNGEYSGKTSTLVREYYQAACNTDQGWNAPLGDPFALNRIAIHEDMTRTTIGLMARMFA